MCDFFTIEGIASTNSTDSFGEIICQDGIDLSQVIEGLVTINIEHGDGFPLGEMSVVGVLTRAEVRAEGLWVKGRIYYAHKYASKIYRELANGGLQLSVELADCIYGEGSASNIVLSGILSAVALTKDPANDDTYAELIKSMSDSLLKQLATELRKLNRVIELKTQKVSKKKRIIVRLVKAS